jgi:hypothetical protein
MMHDVHETKPGFDPRQILVDGCPECERRGADIVVELNHIDIPTFKRAWARSQEFHHAIISTGLHISSAEAPLLRVLGMVGQLLDDSMTTPTINVVVGNHVG